MIVDMHHHLIPAALDDKALTTLATNYYVNYGGGARSEGVNVTIEELKRRITECMDDPDGEKLRRRMARAGIDITIMCVVDDIRNVPDDQEAIKINRNLADFARKHDGKVLALAGVDPRRKAAPELFRRCIEEYGMIGLKWHPDHEYYPNSEEARAVLKVAERLGVPLLTHTGPLPTAPGGVPRRAKYASAEHLDELSQDFPGMKIVAAHMGRFSWREWAQMAQFRPNLYGDMAMWQVFAVANYERFCRHLREIIDIAGKDAVLWGSDACGFSALVPNEQYIQIIKDLPRNAPAGIKFTEEEVAAILGGNAQKVFGL